MEDFLNETLKGMNASCNFDRLSEDFLKSMRINKTIFGKHAFRKSMSGGPARSVINVALFDVFSSEFARWPESTATERKREIRKATIEMLSEEDFIESISRSTNSTRNVKTRFQFIEDHIRPLLQ
jgi:hypothetical protein